MRIVFAFAALVAIAFQVGCSKPNTEIQAEAKPENSPSPLSIDELRERQFDTNLKYERPLQDGASFTAYLVSYRYSGLKLHAMVAVPKSDRPAGGFPVVIANHGYVPDPTKYGITREGIDSRPGDYYRSVPELYASRGFLVVMPDFRGHNASEGFAYINPQDDHSAGYYAEDVVALLAALDEIENTDRDNVFMWSHSMGGAVSMRVLLATDIIKASSFWATMSVDDVRPYFSELDGPLLIHHSVGDTSTDHLNSERLAEALRTIGHPHTFNSYDSEDHYFGAEMRELAADRDAEFFGTLLEK